MNETNNKDWNQPGTWAEELVEQARTQAKRWLIAWIVTMALLLITLGCLVGTNIYWIDVFQSYEYVSQDGDGINNVNSGTQGDLINGPESEGQEKR